MSIFEFFKNLSQGYFLRLCNLPDSGNKFIFISFFDIDYEVKNKYKGKKWFFDRYKGRIETKKGIFIDLSCGSSEKDDPRTIRRITCGMNTALGGLRKTRKRRK
jgi:hypothetical protein